MKLSCQLYTYTRLHHTIASLVDHKMIRSTHKFILHTSGVVTSAIAASLSCAFSTGTAVSLSADINEASELWGLLVLGGAAARLTM